MHHSTKELKQQTRWPLGVTLAFFLLASVIPLAMATDYTRAPPYGNQSSYPQSGYCIVYSKGQICAYINGNTGQIDIYASDSGSGFGYKAWGQFNRNPIPGNSPQVSLTGSFSISSLLDWYGYTYSVGSADATATFILYLYYFRTSPTWAWVEAGRCTLFYSNWQNGGGGHVFDYYGRTTCSWGSPPMGSGVYSVAPYSEAGAFAISGSNAYSDFYYGVRATFTYDVRISA